jgi:RimJ/RimL family protein N-acetyltransferase
MVDTSPAFAFRLLSESELPLLADWLRRPHVLEWWGGSDAALDLEGVTRKYACRMADTCPVKSYIAYLGSEPVGFIQSYVVMGSGEGWWENESDPGVRGIDQFLCDGNKIGQGYGSRMVRAFVQRLFAEPDVTRVQTDPDPGNGRAIRCYEKAGFRAIGEVSTPDGPALLMVMDRSGHRYATSAPDLGPNLVER